MSRKWKYRAGAVLLLLIVGGSSFIATKTFFTSGRSEAQQSQSSKAVDVAAIQQALTAEKQRPRFVGAIDGIFIAPSTDQFPDDLRAKRERLVAGGCVDVPRARAGVLDLAREPVFPAGYVLNPGDPEVIACSDVVTGVNRQYSFTNADGLPSEVLVSRSIATAWGLDVAADRVKAVKVGRRDAIVIRPETPDGTGQTSMVLFPEPFGLTFVSAFNVSASELNQILVALTTATE